MMTSEDEATRRRNAKRSAIFLGVVALAFYFGIMILKVLRG